ncbi:unnamed protein product [Clonostachys rosea]|uniref:Uncharacterized protein n=1 Tax=Bionectria ochroleuca TaxID=29856 RepID=A0ABY6U6M6_BIOOC|nr:unnamed protein product [Clonostachys rosea]
MTDKYSQLLTVPPRRYQSRFRLRDGVPRVPSPLPRYRVSRLVAARHLLWKRICNATKESNMGRTGGIAHNLDVTTSWLGKEHREERISRGMSKATIKIMLPMSAWNIDSYSTEYLEPSPNSHDPPRSNM